jgi:integrase
MASVRKRTWESGCEEKTAWVADYFDQHGKRRLKTCKTKKEASDFLTTCQWEVREGTHTPASASITVKEAVDLWLEHSEAEDLEDGTMLTYGNAAKHHLLPILGRYKLAQLTRPMVEQFRDDLLTGAVPDGKKRSRVMARKALGALKAAIKEAQRRGKVAQNVATGVQIKRSRSEDEDSGHKELGVDVPDQDEVRAILAAVSPRWRPPVVVAVFCGLRSSELRGLRWQDVDFEARVLKVRQRADRWGRIGPPKSKAGRRGVPMGPMVVNTLREWKPVCPASELDLVFPTSSGAVMDHAMVYRQAFGAVQLACGIVRPKLDKGGQPVIGRDKHGEPVLDPETGKPVVMVVPKYGPHAFRHFCASWLIKQNGFSPKQIQGIMGHASIQMTMDVYGHLFPADEDDHAKLAAGEIALVGEGAMRQDCDKGAAGQTKTPANLRVVG